MRRKFNIKVLLLFLLGCLGISTFAQDETVVNEKALKASTNLTWEANKQITDNKFVDAEVDYRRAISKSSQNVVAPYNLGNAYYNNESYSEAFGRFKEAGELAGEEPM